MGNNLMDEWNGQRRFLLLRRTDMARLGAGRVGGGSGDTTMWSLANGPPLRESTLFRDFLLNKDEAVRPRTSSIMSTQAA